MFDTPVIEEPVDHVRARGGWVVNHKLKTHAGWHVEAHPDGRLTWTTPTGHRHTTTPHDYGPEPPGTLRSVPAAGPSPQRAADSDDPDLDPPPF